MNAEATGKGMHLDKRVPTALAILLLLLATTQISRSIAAKNSPVFAQKINLTAYFDGFVLVSHEFEINQTYPTVNISLLSETHENLLFLDEQNTPLDYSVTNKEATVYSLGATTVRASYLTQDLLTKTGQYWTLTANVSTHATVVLPETATIISLNDVPEKIESPNRQVTLVMPQGIIDITYTVEHSQAESTNQQVDNEAPWLFAVAIPSVSILVAVSVFLLLKRRKIVKSEAKEPSEAPAVDLDKLLAREKDLRQEELQVVHFLSEKHGSAFEAELYEKLQLPRTTTWRLLKRLERMEIVDIKKSRRQNIVSIRKKYMKDNTKASD